MDAADIARIADAEHLAKEIAEEEALGRAAAKRKRKRDRQRTAKRRAAVMGAGGLLDGGGGEAFDGSTENFEYTPPVRRGWFRVGGGLQRGVAEGRGKGRQQRRVDGGRSGRVFRARSENIERWNVPGDDAEVPGSCLGGIFGPAGDRFFAIGHDHRR